MKFKIPIASPKLGKKELNYVMDCIKSSWISSRSNYVTEFEEKFSEYCGVRYGITTSSGTTALHLAMASLGIKKGDEVIIPTLTMIATANAVTYTGAKPILVDSEPDYWNIDTDKIQERITDRTKAIVVVHIYGHPVDIDPILDIAEDKELFIVEDAAEAYGAEYKKRRVGGIGDIGCFSFYANKIITTGEGGMLVTDDEKIAERAKILRDHAFSENNRFWHQSLGFSYRMSALQAAVGLAQLEKIDELVEIRRRNAVLYNKLLKSVQGLTLPTEAKWAKDVYWMYSVLVEKDFGSSRDSLMNRLEKAGIETRSFFIPIHKQPIYAKYYKKQKFPVADELSKKGINLPSGSTLKKEEIKYVCESISSLRG
ncbi:MAG: DegT/DnrJ/EryC1/StrS family aminotransferase [Candidatus Aenigmarchaeota archaeon]|nr:DegT/DnrJ/EryC1/StrS family aminotransferase [Candidatus Aenigmarchaeota archaeon]